jgi:hypothetical protein
VAGEVGDRVVVHAPLHDAVDLDRGQAGHRRGVDGLEHDVGVDVVPAAHRGEHVGVEAVQAHGDPGQPCLLQVLRDRGQEGPIGGHGEVETRLEGGDALHQLGQVSPDEGLATGEADLGHSQIQEEAGQPLDLLEAEDFRAREERELLAVQLSRHAVRAAEIATIRDRDAQIAQRPAECVAELVR